MDPISLILAALLAGATTGVGKSAASAVQDAYGALRGALKRRLAGKPAAENALDAYPSDPKEWESNLETHLKSAKADHDQAVLDAASALLRLTDPDGASKGKYNIKITGGQGVVIGENNTSTFTYNSSPPKKSPEDG